MNSYANSGGFKVSCQNIAFTLLTSEDENSLLGMLCSEDWRVVGLIRPRGFENCFAFDLTRED